MDHVESTIGGRAQLGGDGNRDGLGGVGPGLEHLGVARNRVAQRSLGGVDQSAILTVRGQQAAYAGDFAAQVKDIAVARWLNQVLGRFVSHVVDQRLGDAVQRIAPEELDADRAGGEQPRNLRYV